MISFTHHAFNYHTHFNATSVITIPPPKKKSSKKKTEKKTSPKPPTNSSSHYYSFSIDLCNGIHRKIPRNPVLIGHLNLWLLQLVLAIVQWWVFCLCLKTNQINHNNYNNKKKNIKNNKNQMNLNISKKNQIQQQQ